MNGAAPHPDRYGRPTAPPPPPDTVHAVPGTATTEWCTRCKAWTRLSGDVLLLTPTGVARAGRYTWCEVCDDPDTRKPAHG